jgi:hypothetical protein
MSSDLASIGGNKKEMHTELSSENSKEKPSIFKKGNSKIKSNK